MRHTKLLKSPLIAKYPVELIDIFTQFRYRGTMSEFERLVILKADALPTIEESNVFKGDMLEILSELFFDAFENDPAIGIRRYEPVGVIDDYGVDARGVNARGDSVAIQVKFKSNPTDLVSYGSLTNTFFSAVNNDWIDPYKNNTIVIFTNSNGVNHIAKNQFDKKLVVIGREFVKQKIDNNFSFWAVSSMKIFNEISLCKQHRKLAKLAIKEIQLRLKKS